MLFCMKMKQIALLLLIQLLNLGGDLWRQLHAWGR